MRTSTSSPRSSAASTVSIVMGRPGACRTAARNLIRAFPFHSADSLAGLICQSLLSLPSTVLGMTPPKSALEIGLTYLLYLNVEAPDPRGSREDAHDPPSAIQ